MLTANPPTGSGSTNTHPLYGVWAPVWTKLANVYEGAGGFLDGTYLIAHPREWQDYTSDAPTKPTKKLTARRNLARYENVAATILNQVRTSLFRGSISRTIGKGDEASQNHPLAKWWANVDGKGTAISDYMSQTWTACGLFGHLVHYMDRPAGPQPLTKADQKQPYLRVYTPLDLVDWLNDDQGFLAGVKLQEIEPRTDLMTAARADRYRYRVVTPETWQVISSTGEPGESGPHKFGRLPVVLQYSKRRALQSILGQSVLSDPQLYIDLYNLTSELRELLRNQTFSMLNVELGTGDQAITVEKAIEMLNATGGSGTENIIFSAGPSQFITADSSNVEVYQKERSELLRTIYRLSAIPWEADSAHAEAEGSLKLKREDMNQVLAGYADEAEKSEYGFVELWFRGEYGDRWEQELAKAEVTIRYPDTFDVTPFAEILEQAQAAVSLEMPPTFMKELRRRLVAKFLPDATPAIIDEIDKELEQMAKDAPKQARMELQAKLQKMANPGGFPAAA